jgi:hypothetical protein
MQDRRGELSVDTSRAVHRRASEEQDCPRLPPSRWQGRQFAAELFLTLPEKRPHERVALDEGFEPFRARDLSF